MCATATLAPFTCHDCGDAFYVEEGGITIPYVILANDAYPQHRICYECARTRDLEQAAESGRLFAYVTSHRQEIYKFYAQVEQEFIDSVTTWPGLLLNVGKVETINTWRSNFGDVRTAFSCYLLTGPKMVDGLRSLELWHGITYGDNGTYCRLRRAKIQPSRRG